MHSLVSTFTGQVEKSNDGTLLACFNHCAEDIKNHEFFKNYKMRYTRDQLQGMIDNRLNPQLEDPKQSKSEIEFAEEQIAQCKLGIKAIDDCVPEVA